MHLVIINGSPRVKKYSNTDKIITSFTKGFCEKGNTYELYTISTVPNGKRHGMHLKKIQIS